MRRDEAAVDARIESLRRTDPALAAAYALRYRGVCPQCGGRADAGPEDPRSGERIFACLDCAWAHTCTEAQYRASPEVGLREAVERAISIRDARQAALAARQAGRADKMPSPRARPSGQRPAPPSSPDKAGLENGTSGPAEAD